MASVNAEAFFVSRGELLGWLNSSLGLRLQKVEETANGAIACQLLDALHPGVVPLRRVDFNATSEYDAIANYKVLQDCFLKLGVEKPVDVARLVKARPLDNTEFMQWFKAYWDRQTGGTGVVEGYDGPGRRAGFSKTGDLKGGRSVGGGVRGGGGALAAPVAAAAAPKAAAARAAPAAAAAPSQRRIAAATTTPSAPVATSSSSLSQQQQRQLRQEAADAAARAEAAARERDFYWSKLRAIEVLCGAPGASDRHPVLKTVEAILYAPTAEAGEAVLEGVLAELEREGGGGAAPAGAGAGAEAAATAEARAPSPLLAARVAAAAAEASAVMPAGSAELPPLGAGLVCEEAAATAAAGEGGEAATAPAATEQSLLAA